MHSVESDGRRLDNIRDPPGQRSAYIPPGETERETYRLSTFHQYPRDSPMDPRQFAAHGFYYTGYRDRVKCFSCGQPADNWVAGDDVTLPSWHRSDCAFMNGTDGNNVPIGGILIPRSRRTSPRPSNSNSYTTANHTSTITRPTLHNNVQTNSLTFQHSSINHLYNSTTSNQSSSGTLSHSSTSQRYPVLYDTFPCLHPINPHMRTIEGRLQTFLDNASIWPAHRIRATPQQIVDAGMYYLGERDRVKCWYCNGGLQNWERDDDPWEEHAKWFPLCEYVLQQKGPDYVHQIVLRFPGLRRPNLTNPTSRSGAQLVSNAIRGNLGRSNSPAHRSVNQSSAPHIVDPQVELRRINEQVEAEFSRSQIVANAKRMRFSESHIKAALKRQFQVHKQPFSTLEALVDAVLSTEEPASSSAENQEETIAERNEDPTASVDSQSPGQELRRLEESRRCKRCHREDACVVFIPCGHLACCVACSDQIQRCPVCREYIREKVRSYLS